MTSNGSINTAPKRSDNWHSDGSSSPGKEFHLLNFLHTQITPKNGGETVFCCGINAIKLLNENELEICKNLKTVLDTTKIDGLENANQRFIERPFMMKNKHDTAHLYFGFPSAVELVWKDSTSENKYSKLIDLEDFKSLILDRMTSSGNCYVHKWQEGDVLIWDNTLGMHKATPGCSEKRLLYRTHVVAD